MPHRSRIHLKENEQEAIAVFLNGYTSAHARARLPALRSTYQPTCQKLKAELLTTRKRRQNGRNGRLCWRRETASSGREALAQTRGNKRNKVGRGARLSAFRMRRATTTYRKLFDYMKKATCQCQHKCLGDWQIRPARTTLSVRSCTASTFDTDGDASRMKSLQQHICLMRLQTVLKSNRWRWERVVRRAALPKESSLWPYSSSQTASGTDGE